MTTPSDAVSEKTAAPPDTAEPLPEAAGDAPAQRVVKVLVWDLDNTLWNGTLAEGDEVEPRPGVRELLETLDARGILQSIASKNDHSDAWSRLQALGLDHYFLYPQISWSAKSAGIEQIAKSINIGLDAVAFVDDQPFEREEVAHVVPQVLVLPVEELPKIADRPEFVPRFITDESAIRRTMYQADIARNEAEEGFVGPQEDFLSSLEMHCTIGRCQAEDLKRAEELTVRTNQLNATGYTYSYEELDALRRSDDHLLLVASLDDKYGTYGKIGLALIEKGDAVWTVKLLLMSCRVMSRGVGTILMSCIQNLAKDAGARLQAEFRPTKRNRMMLVTYKFGGFREVDERADGIKIFEHDLESIQDYPDYVKLDLEL